MSYCVFFDLDETVVKAKSMLEVVREYYRQNSIFKSFGKARFIWFRRKLICYERRDSDRVNLNKFYYKQLAGMSKIKMCQASKKWLNDNINTIFNPVILNEIEEHRKFGAEILIITGSFFECAQPIANYLNISNVICTQLEEKNSLYTGKMLNDPIIGNGKKMAILEYVKQHKFSLKGSYAYGDHHSDIPMLSLAEHPVVVGCDDKLLEHAREKGWLVINDKNIKGDRV